MERGKSHRHSKGDITENWMTKWRWIWDYTAEEPNPKLSGHTCGFSESTHYLQAWHCCYQRQNHTIKCSPPMCQLLRLSEYICQYLNTTARSPYAQISFVSKECCFAIAYQEPLISALSKQSSTVTRVQFCRNLKLLSSFISIVDSMCVTYTQTRSLPVYMLMCSLLSSTLFLLTAM